jgi:hypothetical protein
VLVDAGTKRLPPRLKPIARPTRHARPCEGEGPDPIKPSWSDRKTVMARTDKTVMARTDKTVMARTDKTVLARRVRATYRGTCRKRWP